MPSSTRQPQDAKVAVTTLSELNSHFAQLKLDLALPETEDSWQKLDRALARLQAITKGGAAKFPEYIPLLKQIAAPINNSLLSERTRLSGTAGDLINSVAPRLVERFDALVPIFVPTLLAICARTNKVAVKRAEKSLVLICKHCKLPSLVPLLKDAARDKSQGLRAVAMGCILALLESTEKAKLARRISDIEASIKGSATDSNPEVRQISKRVFELYIAMWPERVESFTKPLTPTIRRYLALPKTGALIVDVPVQAASVASTAAAPPSRSSASAAPSASSSRHAQKATPASERRSAAPTRAESHHAVDAPEPANFPSSSSSSSKRPLFADQLSAVRSQQKASRGPQVHDGGALASMRAPLPVDAGRHERHREIDVRLDPLSLPSSSSRRALRYYEEPEPEPPTISAGLRASISSRSATSATTTTPHAASLSSSTSSHKNPLSVSLGPSSSSSSRHLGSSTSGNAITSFAAASGLHGRSQILAAYSQAFSKDHLRTSSHPDLGSLASSSSSSKGPSRGNAGALESGDDEGGNRPRQGKPLPSRSRSDDATPSDPIAWLPHHQENGPAPQRDHASKPQSGDGGHAAPSEGVAERLVRQLQKMQDSAGSDERPGRAEGASSSSLSSSSSAGAPTGSSGGAAAGQSQTKQQVKASRVPATRPVAPAKASAARVSRPTPTPSASRTSALRASTTSSTASTPAPASATPKAREGQSDGGAASEDKAADERGQTGSGSGSGSGASAVAASHGPKEQRVDAEAADARSTSRPAGGTQTPAAPSAKTSHPVGSSSAAPKPTGSTTGKPRVVVVPTGGGKQFQPKPLAGRADAKARAKVTSSLSASLAPKTRLVGGGAGATDKATLVKKAVQARAVSVGSKTEQQKRGAAGVQKRTPMAAPPPPPPKAAAAPTKPAGTEVAVGPKAAPGEAPEAVETPSTPSRAAASAVKAPAASTPSHEAAVAAAGGGSPKRTPLGARDTNVVRKGSPAANRGAIESVKRGGQAMAATVAPPAATAAARDATTQAAVSPSARIAAAMKRRQAEVAASQGRRAAATAAVSVSDRDGDSSSSSSDDDEEEEEEEGMRGDEAAVLRRSRQGALQLVIGDGADVGSDAETVVMAN
ncbi:uncharacterized protein PFL1_02561 [Pseudozyma flocculosa PF-1]|uniref:TOG domain-containing protein n=2 Tax=Pseudozyma flocculosa TaxID=84751 RepID=A0A5C3F1N5_9BASI|nr:uncharacterized protein PFL1_02561 [Pseudozyma flocculosa PF-1]EPQ29888.1 hypothetical protein PFL1_02561 [Pseudozyma flocculosa PF-1]SPO37191.1 uncharacterized protein PSFLO_02663 [Pseudozyma flocculosa]